MILTIGSFIAQHWLRLEKDMTRPWLTPSRRHRLLPEQFPHWHEWLLELGPLEPPTFHFQFCTLNQENWVDLFTDGSCKNPSMVEGALATWACVSATHALCLASGPLTGPAQTVDRSEVTALLAALTWADETNTKVTVWMDSGYAATGLWRLLETPDLLPYSSNEDLWTLCQELVKRVGDRIRGQHINSHRTEDDCVNAVDSWTMFWNEAADKAAATAHTMHSRRKPQLWTALCDHQRAELRRQEQLQALHLSIAEARRVLSQQMDEIARDAEGPADHELDQLHLAREGDSSLFELLPSTWLADSQRSNSFLGFGLWGVQFVQALQEIDTSPRALLVSWLELAVWAWTHFRGRVPVAGPRKGQWLDPGEGSNLLAGGQTLAAVLRLVRSLVRCLIFDCGADAAEYSGLDLSMCGVAPPQRGICLRWTPGRIHDVRLALTEFCGRRRVRTVNDLARPLRRVET